MSNIGRFGRLAELTQRDFEIAHGFEPIKPPAQPPAPDADTFSATDWLADQYKREAVDYLNTVRHWRVDIMARHGRIVTLYATGTRAEVQLLISRHFHNPFSMVVVPSINGSHSHAS